MIQCILCDKLATWERCTQFAGDHPFCDQHALEQNDFGVDDSYKFWAEIKEENAKLHISE